MTKDKYIIEVVADLPAARRAMNTYAKQGYTLHTIEQYEDESWLLVMEEEGGAA